MKIKHVTFVNKSFFLIIVFLPFFFMACSSGSDGESDSTTASKTATNVKSIKSPCEVITSQDIKEFFKVEDTTEIKVEESSTTFPMCSYEWGEDVFMSHMKVGDHDIEYGSPAKVTIVMAKGVSNGGFEQSTSVYKDPEDISGIGEMARWSPKMSQLTFLIKGTLFHVHIKVSADKEANKSKAIELSKLILQKV